MRALVAAGLALLVAAHSGAARGDPAAPQVDPLHGRREDAQRLTEQLRELDHARSAAAPVAPLPVQAQAQAQAIQEPPPRGLVIGGMVLIGVAATTGLVTIALYANTNDATLDNTKIVFAVTSALAGVAGLALVVAGQRVQIAPSVTPKAVGLALAGRL